MTDTPHPEVWPEVWRVWVQFQGEGHRQPTYRQMRAGLTGNGVRLRNSALNVQLRHLRSLESDGTDAGDATPPPAIRGT